MAWLRSACVVSGMLLVGAACREQPEGVVLKIQGVDKAEQLWLTVGGERTVVPGPMGTESLRFVQTDLSKHYDKDEKKIFADGDEVLLDSAELMANDEISVVLDTVVNRGGSGGEENVDILRAAYAFDLESGVLNEVKLNPAAIGPGQWVCAGKPGNDGVKSFAIVPSLLRLTDQDCDRDGWTFGDDLDDADPLRSGDLKWVVEPGVCSIRTGRIKLRLFNDIVSCDASCETKHSTSDEIEGCLEGSPLVRCLVGTAQGRISVKKIVDVMNPDWELVRLGPDNAKIAFAPSARSPNEWFVQFDLSEMEETKRRGYFVLNDRAPGPSRTVILQYAPGTREPTCTMENYPPI